MAEDKDKKSTETLEEKVTKFLGSYEEKLKDLKASNEQVTDQKLDSLKKEMSDKMEEYIKTVRQNNVSVPGTAEATYKGKGFDFAKFAQAVITKDWSKAEFEQDICKEARVKAQDTNTGAQGGFLIPTELAFEKLIKPAIAQSVMKKLGIQMFNGLTDDLEIPEAENRPVLTFASDGATATENTVLFGKKLMTPKTGNMLIKLSNKLLKQTTVASGIIETLMREGIQIGMDNIAINGTGSNSQPLGILNSVDLPTAIAIGTNGGRLTVDKIAQMIADVEDTDFLASNQAPGVLLHPRAKSGMKRERVAQFSTDTSGMPLINPLMTDAVLNDTLGSNIVSTTNMAKDIEKGTSTSLSQVLVGQFDRFAWGTWGGMSFKSSDVAGTAFETNQTWLVAFVDMDTLMLQKDAFSLLSDAETDESNW